MMTKENRIKSLDMLKLVLSGETYENVGKKYEVSGARVRQIISKIKRMMLHPERWEGEATSFHHSCGIHGMREDIDLWLSAVERMEGELQ